MSITYTSTSFGTSPSSAQSGSARQQQRQSASSSHSSVTFASAASTQGIPFPATAPSPTRSSHSENAMRAQYDQIGAFFGARPDTEHSRDNNSRRGNDHASTTTATIPPSYDGDTEVESLPTYSKVEEYDAKVNRKLFIYGFLFFPLWIIGIVAPFVKPDHDPSRDNRSKEDQETDYASMRKVEMRWAKRSAAALFGFTVVVIVAVVVGVTVANNN